MNLKQLHAKIKKCKKCSLYKTRINAVPGEGKGKLMFIGEYQNPIFFLYHSIFLNHLA